jgi:hypothetical protein
MTVSESIRKSTVAGIVALGVLAVLSWITTLQEWHGEFPSGKWVVCVVTPEGMPVCGARLAIVVNGEPVSWSPFDNYREVDSVATDRNGDMLLVNKKGGPGYGGHRWYLYWLLPIGNRPERPVCELRFSAKGYMDSSLSSEQVLESAGAVRVTLRTEKSHHEGNLGTP